MREDRVLQEGLARRRRGISPRPYPRRHQPPPEWTGSLGQVFLEVTKDGENPGLKVKALKVKARAKRVAFHVALAEDGVRMWMWVESDQKETGGLLGEGGGPRDLRCAVSGWVAGRTGLKAEVGKDSDPHLREGCLLLRVSFRNRRHFRVRSQQHQNGRFTQGPQTAARSSGSGCDFGGWEVGLCRCFKPQPPRAGSGQSSRSSKKEEVEGSGQICTDPEP